jgi:hypothetical protein
LSLDVAFTWAGVEAKEVEGELFEDGKVMSGIMGTSAHLVVSEDDIHAPVKAVLDMPVLADGGSETGCVRGKAGDVETSFGAGLAFEEAGGFDDGEGFQVGPTLHKFFPCEHPLCISLIVKHFYYRQRQQHSYDCPASLTGLLR